MKVLLIRGNPRKTGLTQQVTDRFLKGVLASGADVTDVDAVALAIEPCTGCYTCWAATPGHCIHDDAMKDLLPVVRAADVIVFSTPVNYYAMSGSLKTFIERLFPFFAPGIERSARGYFRNRCRYPADFGRKKLITIVVGSLRHLDTFGPVNETFRLIADSLDMQIGGQLTRPESYLLQFTRSKPKTVRLIEQAFVDAGMQAGTTGCLSAQTMEQAAQSLSVDDRHFETYSNIYWDRAIRMGAAANLASLRECISREPAILMREMARSVDPKATARVRAVIQMDFPDQDLHYRLTVDRGQCDIREQPTPEPDLRITCNASVWVDFMLGQLDLHEALRGRQIVVEGDKALFTRLGRFFPPPS
ncbi:MAG: hypothetical protein BWK77_08265 [Verrucomicrobia bacterium A1]|nr:MAG: hypothetical protein BWK77_08265 [Verrucomicrobia bacterium A1]